MGKKYEYSFTFDLENFDDSIFEPKPPKRGTNAYRTEIVRFFGNRMKRFLGGKSIVTIDESKVTINWTIHLKINPVDHIVKNLRYDIITTESIILLETFLSAFPDNLHIMLLLGQHLKGDCKSEIALNLLIKITVLSRFILSYRIICSFSSPVEHSSNVCRHLFLTVTFKFFSTGL